MELKSGIVVETIEVNIENLENRLAMVQAEKGHLVDEEKSIKAKIDQFNQLKGAK